MSCPGLQWGSSQTVPRASYMGPHHWTEAGSPILHTQEGVSTHTRQAKGTAWVCPRATSERIHLPIKKPLCSTILLHQKERWQATPGIRLQMAQQVDDPQLLSHPINLRANSQSTRSKTFHQCQPSTRIQQCLHQKGRWMESYIYHQSWTIQTHC